MKNIFRFFFIVFCLFTTTNPLCAQSWAPLYYHNGWQTCCLAANGTNLFAGTQYGGVILSTDYGTSWNQVNSGLWNTSINILTFSGSTLFAGTQGGGIFLSTSNGTSWTAANTGLPGGDSIINAFAFSGSYLFAGADSGVFLSTNNGTSWNRVNNGLTHIDVRALIFSGTKLFAGTKTGGAFVSTDYGASWTEVNNGLTDACVFTFAVIGTNLFAGTQTGGVFLSTNDGTSWTQVNSGLTNNWVYSFAVSGTTLYAGTWGSSVFQSTDYGASWTPFNTGMQNYYVTSLAILGTNLFAGTGTSAARIYGRTLSTQTTLDGGIWKSGNVLAVKFKPSATITGAFTGGNFGIRWKKSLGTGVNLSSESGAFGYVHQGARATDGIYYYIVYTSATNKSVTTYTAGTEYTLMTVNVPNVAVTGTYELCPSGFAGNAGQWHIELDDADRANTLPANWYYMSGASIFNLLIDPTAAYGGLFGAENVLTVKFIPYGQMGNINGAFTGGSFGIRWLSSWGAEVTLTGESGVFGYAHQGAKATSGLYDYIVYASTSSIASTTYVVGTSYTLMTVNVTGGTGIGTFELCPQGFENDAGFWSFEIGGVNYADNQALGWYYQSSAADVVLPVELVSFTASVNLSMAELKWSTATEVNNYGFNIERRSVDSANAGWLKVGFVHGSGTCNVPHEYTFTDKTVAAGRYAYRLQQVDNNRQFKYSQETEVTIEAPKVFALSQNYPNPFNPLTKISLSLPSKSFVSLKIFDLLGREVETLISEELSAGSYVRQWNAINMPSGIYFYRLQADSFIETKKLILLK
jgi:photosystem II stability/assembly factor-like uncharacterized protein